VPIPRPAGWAEWKDDSSFWVTFSPDGRWLIASMYSDNDINPGHYFFRVPDWKLEKIIPTPKTTPDAGCVFSADGSLMALAISRRRVRLIDTVSGKTIAHLSTLTEAGPRPLVFSPDGTRLVASTVHGSVLIWDLRRIREQLEPLGLAGDWPPNLGLKN
jgi:WD40 repeat protein